MNHHQLSTIIILSINVNHLNDHAWPLVLVTIATLTRHHSASITTIQTSSKHFEALYLAMNHDRPLYRPLQMNCFIPSLAIMNCCLIYHHYKWSLTIIDHYKWSKKLFHEWTVIISHHQLLDQPCNHHENLAIIKHDRAPRDSSPSTARCAEAVAFGAGAGHPGRWTLDPAASGFRPSRVTGPWSAVHGWRFLGLIINPRINKP